MRSFFILIGLGLFLLLLALVVRSGIFLHTYRNQEPMNSAMRYELSVGTQGRPELSTDDARYIDEHYVNILSKNDGLRYRLIQPGKGKPPQTGDQVTVAYTGHLLGGPEFDHSDAFTFRVGTGQVIKGWDEAVSQMRPGEKRLLIIPYWLAYGEKGHPPVIPPKATLVFEVQVLGIKP